MFIKLTHVSDVVMYVNSEHIVQFFNSGGATTLLTLNGTDHVKEAPEQICEMLGVSVWQ